MQTIADGNNRFALDLYAKLRESETGNLFFSPFSAHTALAMTAVGARGNTRDEMVKVLHLPADEEKMLASGELGSFYAHPRKDFELAVANAIWGQKNYPWRPEFLDVQKARFSAGFQEADFRADPDGERRRINRWVEEKTRDRIKDLLAPPLITRLTRMVLANAVYFKGQWESQFDPKATRDGPFTLADGSQVMVPMMSRSGGFRQFAEWKEGQRQPGLQVAELPYRGGELSMVILLPGKHDGLPALEAKLSAGALADWLGKAAEMKESTGLFVPKFRLETGAMMLNGPLHKLGMVDAFVDGVADFSGMGGSPGDLHVSVVVQKAFVDVNEEGTEAAAATAVVVNARGGGSPPPFRADRPFLFLIRDAKRGTILFMGRVMNPKG